MLSSAVALSFKDENGGRHFKFISGRAKLHLTNLKMVLSSFRVRTSHSLEGTQAAKTGSIASHRELSLWLARVLVPVIESVGRLSSLPLRHLANVVVRCR